MTTTTTDISTSATATTTSIRRMDLESTDRAAVVRLAALDSSTPLEGPVLGLELDGRLVAAVSLADGASIADPFRRTAEARDLLDLRVKQLRRESRRRHGARRRPLALGGSPAGQIGALPRPG
jgi:hypothetical protein